MANERKGEKSGWTLGWSGGFIWVLLLAVVRLAQGDPLNALAGGILVILAVIAIRAVAPWRHPARPYWTLMSPLYLILFLALAWLLWLSGGMAQLGLSPWSLFLLLPLLLPLYLNGKRRWVDGDHTDT
ncbi:MAG TPA: hypothetical protein VJK02_10200 [Anaerolineales bacterium]|nr:hypothetical protein [Anaerolineales bacterium]